MTPGITIIREFSTCNKVALIIKSIHRVSIKLPNNALGNRKETRDSIHEPKTLVLIQS